MSRQLVSGSFGDRPPIVFSQRLAHLVLVPTFATPRERLDAALGPELARFLLSALTSQVRVGSSSPYVRT